MTLHRVYKPSPSSRLTQKKASSFAPRPFAPLDAAGLEMAQADHSWPQRMERASRLGHNFVSISSQPEVVQRVKKGKEPAQTPPRQLHIFVNLEGIPANRVAVFLQHFMGRLDQTGGRGTALNIGVDYAPEDISKASKLNPKEPEVKNETENDPKKVAALRDKLNSKHRKYSERLDPLDEEPGKYDEVVVIGVAQPTRKTDENDLYESYANVSGLKEIAKLSDQIQALVKQNLKDDGHLRVQLCHAGSVKVEETGETFSKSLVPPEKKEITISAPKSFSVIGDHGGFVDFTTKMGIFDKSKGLARERLLGKLDPTAPVEDQLEARKAAFLKKLSPGARSQVKDFEFGNLGETPVDEEELESDPVKIVGRGGPSDKEEPQSDPLQDIGPGAGEGGLVDQEQEKRIQRLSLLKDLKNKELIKQTRYAQEVQRIAKLKPGSGREGRRLANRSGLFGRKHESTTRKIAEYEKELAGLE